MHQVWPRFSLLPASKHMAKLQMANSPGAAQTFSASWKFHRGSQRTPGICLTVQFTKNTSCNPFFGVMLLMSCGCLIVLCCSLIRIYFLFKNTYFNVHNQLYTLSRSLGGAGEFAQPAWLCSWTWGRLLTLSLGKYCGKCFRSMGYWTPS